MPLLELPTVTLVAIDTRAPALAAQSLARSMAVVRFARAVLFMDEQSPAPAVSGLEVVRIPTLRGGADYSRFVVHDLPAHVHTGHVLVTQWDGFVRDAAAWRDEFLQWDYVGAVWPDQPPTRSVGNGGFSLRSRRFLDAARAQAPEALHPEDLVLCLQRRDALEQAHGVRFAPPALARAFAHENERPRQSTFGFHGPRNLPGVLDEATLARWLPLLPDEFFRSRDARRLARAMIGARMAGAAQQVLARRRAVGRTEPASRLLSLAAHVMQRLAPRAP